MAKRDLGLSKQQKQRMRGFVVGDALERLGVARRAHEGEPVPAAEVAALVGAYEADLSELQFAVVTRDAAGLVRRLGRFVAELVDDINVTIRLRGTDFDLRDHVQRHMGRYLDADGQRLVLQAL